MKAIATCTAIPSPAKRAIYLKPNASDWPGMVSFFQKLEAKAARKGFVIRPTVIFEVEPDHRSDNQNSSMWKLITILFQLQNGRLPTKDEKYDLYLDVLDAAADKKLNRFTHELRAIHISESNVFEAAKIINWLVNQIALEIMQPATCGTDGQEISNNLQVDVRGIITRWHQWRGDLEKDPLDYADQDCTQIIDDKEWRERHQVSEASGLGGCIEKAHIVSRGADQPDIEMPWNWLALIHQEHIGVQHQTGMDELVQQYPHLAGRVKRARELAGKL